MKETFAWRCELERAEVVAILENGVVVLDTSVILDLYTLPAAIAQRYMDSLRRVVEHLWIPYQVAREYLDRREIVLNRTLESGAKAKEHAARWARDALNRTALSSKCAGLEFMAPHVRQTMRNVVDGMDLSGLQREFERVIAQIGEALDSAMTTLSVQNAASDHVNEFVQDLFDGRTGPPPSSERTVAIREDRAYRKEKQIPPGRTDDEMGDLLIWHELLDFAAQQGKPVLFVTSERKPDWWAKNEAGKRVPAPILREEFQQRTGRQLWILETTDFLELLGVQPQGDASLVSAPPPSPPQPSAPSPLPEAEEMQRRRATAEGVLRSADMLNDAVTRFHMYRSAAELVNDPLLYRKAAEAGLHAGQWAQARELDRMALAVDPDQTFSWVGVVVTSAYLNDFPAAEDAFNHVKALTNESGYYYAEAAYWYGAMLTERSKHEEARPLLQYVLQYSEVNSPYFIGLRKRAEQILARSRAS